jgi:feruloyl-CoA synthase
MTGLGMTETSPSCTFGTGDIIKAGYVGVPAPGCKVKLVPSGDKLEARFHGPHVTPGYWRAPLLTAEAFDSEGYYCTGDALRFYDPIARNWASCSTAASPKTSSSIPAPSSVWGRCGRASSARRRHVMDVVVTGIDRHAIGLLVFRAWNIAIRCPGWAEGASVEEVLSSAPVRERFQSLLSDLNADASGSSMRIDRLLLQAAAVDRSSRTDRQRLHQSGGGASAALPSLHRFMSSDPNVIIVHKTKQRRQI